MAPADRSVASATSVLSGLAFDFGFLGVRASVVNIPLVAALPLRVLRHLSALRF